MSAACRICRTNVPNSGCGEKFITAYGSARSRSYVNARVCRHASTHWAISAVGNSFASMPLTSPRLRVDPAQMRPEVRLNPFAQDLRVGLGIGHVVPGHHEGYAQ